MKTHTYDMQAFIQGQKVRTDIREWPEWVSVFSGAMVGNLQTVHATVVTKTIPAIGTAPSIDHAFDPVILMLQQMAFPIASIVLAWACLRAMIGHPAQGVDQAKWAIIGYLAMRYAPEILRHI